MENDALDLGTEFEFGLTELSDNRERYTVAQLITALTATTRAVETRTIPPPSGRATLRLPTLLTLKQGP